MYVYTKNNKNDFGKNRSHFYGASNGIRLEEYCVEFAELSIHETDLIEQVLTFIYGKSC